ncbi:class I SAM-dependent methyltransferase [Paenibacillus eucommiae]|uniref:Ubiquinone/menaquinone biosynthesis C-methylase UbiE n=1 Tax=Paenibacillus eucommiae TaxID=1355755 RepID=A0ABS4IV35_9BACL|nr:class I SAM-dependent methyltransferase [Paenibacillus eucommiae]MBP1990856.1 ubiquinone/menaquinone biosynthesis C-methylase UbiE [Paenibacillus eucommiae]
MTDQQKDVWDRLWSGGVSYAWDPLSDALLKSIQTVAENVKGKKLLEAGSGTGKISLHLARLGADVTLVDYSENALVNSRGAFLQAGCEANFHLADIRQIPVPDNEYDLTWNAGVLEHFTFEEKVSILKEMARITKPEGTVLVYTPYAKCLPYQIGKAYAEKQGTWMYGVEEPVLSLKKEFKKSKITLVKETHLGFLNSLDFLDFLPGSGAMKQWMHNWYEGLSAEEQSHFPGYLLVSVGRL